MAEIDLSKLGGMSLDELKRTRTELLTELRELHYDDRGEVRSDLTDEQSADYGRRMRQLDRVEGHMKIREQFERGGGSVERAFGGNLTGSAPEVRDVVHARPDEVRSAALRMLEGAKHLRSDQQDQVDALLRSTLSEGQPNTDGVYIAKRAVITEAPAYRSAFRQLLAERHPLLTAEEVSAVRSLRQLESEYRAMSEGTPASGGYGVPVFIDPTIILTAQGSTNPFTRISRIATITTNAWKGVSSAGVTWSWDGEAVEVSDDSPTLAQPSVPVYTARGFVPYSIEVGQDYPGFAEEMTKLLAEGYDELTAQAFATGSGTDQPNGVLTKLDATTTSEVTLTTAGTFAAADVNKVWEALPDRYKGRATWVMSYGVGDQVAAFGNGNNLSFVTVDLTSVVQTLRQRPVEYSSYFPGALSGTSHQNVAVVGDFSNFLIARRAGMNVEPVPVLMGSNQRPTGQRGLFAWARTGSDVVNANGLRLLNQT